MQLLRGGADRIDRQLTGLQLGEVEHRIDQYDMPQLACVRFVARHQGAPGKEDRLAGCQALERIGQSPDGGAQILNRGPAVGHPSHLPGKVYLRDRVTMGPTPWSRGMAGSSGVERWPFSPPPSKRRVIHCEPRMVRRRVARPNETISFERQDSRRGWRRLPGSIRGFGRRPPPQDSSCPKGMPRRKMSVVLSRAAWATSARRCP